MKPKKSYQVTIPEFAVGTILAYSEEQAIAMFIIREMRKRRSDTWWNGRRYSGAIGEKSLIEDILYLNPKYNYATEVQKKELPNRPEQLQLPLDVVNSRLQFTGKQAIEAALELPYDNSYYCRLYGVEALSGKLASNANEWVQLKALYNTERPFILQLDHKGVSREAQLELVRSELLANAEIDPVVQELLKEGNLTVNDLQEVEVTIDSQIACTEAPKVTASEIRLGQCCEADSSAHNLENFIVGLSQWLQIKEKPELGKVAAKAFSRDVVKVASLEDQLYQLGLPKVAIREFIRTDSHPYFTLSDSELIKHAAVCILEKFGAPKEARVLAVDFDGTIAEYEEGQFPKIGKPEPGVREALDQLKKAGWYILIFSCRAATADQRKAMKEWLDTNSIPYDDIWKDANKPMAEAYIDDRAIQYKSNWKEIVQNLSNKTSAALVCTLCKRAQLWDPSRNIWECTSCNTHQIIERVAVKIFGLKPQDTVSFKLGTKEVTDKLVKVAHRGSTRIWQTVNGHLVSERTAKFTILKKENLEPVPWLKGKETV